jgi:hypothetical protein
VVGLVGVELEGGWSTSPDCEMHSDGSLRDLTREFSGEISSPPMIPELVTDWVRKNYPDQVNKSCGLHVHVSFKSDLEYQTFMRRKFFLWFVQKLKNFGTRNKIEYDQFWNRLSGSNSYCEKKYSPDHQAMVRHKESACRYSILNYCYRLHGTIECRVLPMFDEVETSIKAINEIVRLFNVFYETQEKPLEEIAIKMSGSNHEETEVMKICV